METLRLVGSLVTLVGSLFLFLGALGAWRMPDVYNRMQSGTKATTLGSMLFLVGLALGCLHGPCLGRVILLIIFIVLTNPISSHALARAAHYAGVPLAKISRVDHLAEDGEREEEELAGGDA